MTRTVTVDLDNPTDVERVWHEHERVSATRAADPELRADVLRAIDKALATGRIITETAAQIRNELDGTVPAVVLEAHASELIEDRPTIGAYLALRAEDEPAYSSERIADFPNAWLRADPSRLSRVVDGALGLTSNLRRVVEIAFAVAARAGIDESHAEPYILAAVREQAKGASDVG